MSTGEGPADPGLVSSPQASGVKVLETLKKHVFEHSDAPRYVAAGIPVSATAGCPLQQNPQQSRGLQLLLRSDGSRLLQLPEVRLETE